MLGIENTGEKESEGALGYFCISLYQVINFTACLAFKYQVDLSSPDFQFNKNVKSYIKFFQDRK